jgi:WD40 repeat protein
MRTDILLLTATMLETATVLEVFEANTGQPARREALGATTYYDLGTVQALRIALAQSEMGADGPGGSTLVADEGIRELSPRAIMLVGIAFGFDEQKQQIGDVLVAKEIMSYEQQKIAQEPISRAWRVPSSTRLLDRCRATAQQWQKARVHFGLLLSGDKLVDLLAFREQLRAQAPEALGGEMEAVGLVSAALRRNIPWIVIKSISDWADGQKAQQKTERQRLAASNAAHFTLSVLQQGDICNIDESKDSSRTTGTLLYKHQTHTSFVLLAEWHPQGQFIASAGGDGTIQVWDAWTGKTLYTYRGHRNKFLQTINHPRIIYMLAWSPDGQRIASSGGNRVAVWNAFTGETQARYEGHSGFLGNVLTLTWSPDGQQIASIATTAVSFDKPIHLWDSRSGAHIKCYTTEALLSIRCAITALAWSPDGNWLAAGGSDKKLRIWHRSSEKPVSLHELPASFVYELAWSPDSRLLAAACNQHAYIWDRQHWHHPLVYREHTAAVRDIAWSPDGQRIATASNDHTVQLWDAQTGTQLYTYTGHRHWVTSANWSPDGRLIASASNDTSVHVWWTGY